MIPELVLSIRNRAHHVGAEWVIAQKAGDTSRAATARGQYFRELEAIDILMGDSPSSFAGLG